MTTPGAAGWDCHAHLFGPYARYPLAANPSYAPPPALQAKYLALLDRLNLSNGVLVQPSAYDRDHSLLFDVLAAWPQLRGVVVARTGTFASFAGLRDRGVRAARFSHRSGSVNFAGSASFDELLHSAGALADAGLHAELWTDCRALPDIAARLEALPVPVVIDHMGGFDVDAGVDEPGFRCLLALLESGRVWVKLCAYRNLPGAVSVEAGRPFHRALLEANASNLVWGSDWPHLRMNPAPDAAELLECFRHWTGNAGLIERVLVGNPARLYA
jgi:predicted TIM-barrel fold metal-dependent hydrolase